VRGHAEGPRASGRAYVDSGRRGECGHGHDISVEAPEGGGPRRDGVNTPKSYFG
jgi:hypothetical protein